jgi:hypothetical protein
MIGQIPELNDPANYGARVNTYPNAYYTTSPAGAQPSIMGRVLYIPLGAWFNLLSTQAFPLVALQYNELQINISFRPVYEWFTIRDVMDYANNFPVVQPNFNQFYMQLYRFLQTPPDEVLGPTSYVDTRTNWNADINLNCTYCFLSNDESELFAKNEQKYIFKQVYETPYYNITGQNKIYIDSIGMVISWMFYFQRSDVNLRNQWSNYTNWPYNYMPQDVSPAPTAGDVPNPDPSGPSTIGPGLNPDGTLSGLFTTGVYNPQNIQYILVALGILLDGQYRENTSPSGVYNFVEDPKKQYLEDIKIMFNYLIGITDETSYTTTSSWRGYQNPREYAKYFSLSQVFETYLIKLNDQKFKQQVAKHLNNVYQQLKEEFSVETGSFRDLNESPPEENLSDQNKKEGE